MARYSGSGWHKQSIRHSNARKYGKAGGIYSPFSQIRITFNPRKKEYAVLTTNDKGEVYYAMNKNSGTTKWFGMKKSEAIKLANEITKTERPVGWYDIGHKNYGQADNKRQIFDYNKLSAKEKEKFCETYNINSNDDLDRVANKINYTDQLKKGIIEEQTKKNYGYSSLHYIPAPELTSANNLPIQVSILVPNTKRDEPITKQEFNKRIKETKNFFNQLKDKKGNTGGETTTNTTGSYWDGEKKERVDDEGAIVERSMSIPTYKKNINKIVNYAKKKRKDYQQDTMLMSIEGRKFIIPNKEYIDNDEKTSNKKILIT